MSRESESNKESIQVTIRVRPPKDKELNEDPRVCVRVDKDSHTLVLQTGGTNADSKAFTFDSICDYSDSQKDIFEKVGINSTQRCLEGYNCCIFAYGQTGAGKTFTMMGVNYEDTNYFELRGLIPRTLEYLFECIDREVVESRTQYLVKCTFLEIYNEQIIDLLNKTNVNLQLREDLKKGVYVEGISEETISRSEEAMEILRRGSKGRHVGSTYYNQTSSRSHSVLSMLLESKAIKNGIMNVKTRRFHFIDLAGSERTRQSNGERLKEGCSINKSLHVLGMVINSLVESTQGKTRHVNYRDSKLTFLLKDALGGNSKTHLIANISPIAISCQETLSTLTFARRVKLIKLNKVSINEDASGNLESLKGQIRRLKQEIVQLRSSASREVAMEIASGQENLNQPARAISEVMARNQGKLDLEKILQDYIEESIEKDTKFELELLRRDEKMALLDQALSQYARNETHLRTIVSLYEQKFKRLKNLEIKLNKKLDELSVTEKQAILGHINSEKELLSRELQQYKELMSQTPFLKSLLKQGGIEERQDDGVNMQLISNLNFLKELKVQLEQTVKERQDLNALIENYAVNQQQQLSPRKRKELEKEQELKEKQFLQKIEQLELEAAYLKGAAQETELLLKDSVDRELTLQEKVAEQASIISDQISQLKHAEERDQQKQIALAKAREQAEIFYEQKISGLSLQVLACKQKINLQQDLLAEAQKKARKCDQTIQHGADVISQMQMKYDTLERSHKVLEQQCLFDKEYIAQRDDTITKLNLNAERQQKAIAELRHLLETERDSKRIMREEFELERQQLLVQFNQRMEILEKEAEGYRTREQQMARELEEAFAEKESRAEKIGGWEQKYSAIVHQLEAEKAQLKKREQQVKQLLLRKANTDNQLQTKVSELSLQLMTLSDKLKGEQETVQQLRDRLLQLSNKQSESERELEARNREIQKLSDQLETMRQKQRTAVKAKDEIETQAESLRHSVREEQDKQRRLQEEIEILKLRERELTQNNGSLQKDLEASEHRVRESMQAGTRISEQLKEFEEEYNRKERIVEKMKEAHEKELNQSRGQLESYKEKSLAHETYMKRVFEECLANKDRLMSDLKSQFSLLQSQLSQQQKKSSQSIQHCVQLESKLKETNQLLAEKEASIQEVNEHLLVLKDEVDHMKNIYEQKIEERENNYNDFIDKKNEELDRYEVQVKGLNTQIADMSAKTDNLSRQIEVKEEQIKELRGLIEKLGSEVGVKETNAPTEIAEAVSKACIELKSQSFKASSVQSLQQTIIELTQQLTVQRQSKTELSQTLGRLSTQLSTTQSHEALSHDHLQKRIAELQSQLLTMNSELHTLKSMSTEQTQQKLELQERLENTTLEMETIQAQFTESQVQVRQLSDALEDREIQIVKIRNSMGARITELEAEVEQTRKVLADEMAMKEAMRVEERERAWKERVDSLKAQNQGFKAKIAQMYNEISGLQSTVSALEIKQINISKEIGEVENQKKQLTAKFNNLFEQNQQKTAHIGTLQKQKQAMQKVSESFAEQREKLAFQLRQAETLQQQLNKEKVQQMQHLKSEFLNSLQQTNALNEDLSNQNNRLKEEAQSVIIGLQREKQMLEHDNNILREQLNELSNECEHMKEQLIMNQSGTSQAQGLEEELRVERNNNCNLKKLIQNLQRQKMQLQAEIQDKDQTQKRLLGKMAKVEAQPPRASEAKNTMRTNDLLQRSRMQLLEYKKMVEQNNKLVKRLKSQMQSKQESFMQMHDKAEEYCRNQELKVANIRSDYEKLQNEQQLLLREKERLQNEAEALREELHTYKTYQSKADRRLEELQMTVQNMNAEMMDMRDELESYRREPARVGGETNQEVKLQYLNKIKEENSLLKREKQILSDRLNKQTEEKLRLKAQLNGHEKKLTREAQSRTSLTLLESMSNDVQITLKIELQRKLAQIKYLQQGYAQLCVLLGIKRPLQNKAKAESTVGVIMSMVQSLIQELNEVKMHLREKQKQLDSKNVTYEIINKQYNHLKSKILEAKGVKDREQSYQKRPSNSKVENTFTSIRNSIQEAYKHPDPGSFEDMKQQVMKVRELSKARKDKMF